jgi:superfamily II DNA/RNA helicase
MNTFAEFGLLHTLQESLLEKGILRPTEIQVRALPALLSGRSIVGIAETGSGKTLAYALPAMHHIKSLEIAGDAITLSARPRAIVVVPTRELGEQVTKAFKPFTHTTRLRVRSVLGGTTTEVAKRGLAGPFEILVATPGRLVQMLERRLVELDDVRMLILDEADQMLDHGFMPDVTKIIQACPQKPQLALFSATVSPAVEKLIADLFSGAEVIRSAGSHAAVQWATEERCSRGRAALLEQVRHIAARLGRRALVKLRADLTGEVAYELVPPCAYASATTDVHQRTALNRLCRL